MHVARQTPQELVVVSGSRWVSAICVAAAVFYTYIAIARHAPRAYLLLTVFLLLFAAIMDLRKTFIFDATRRIVRWKGRTVLKAESGEIPFDEITDIGTETKRAGSRAVPVYRLTSSLRETSCRWHTPAMGNPTAIPPCASRFSTSSMPAAQAHRPRARRGDAKLEITAGGPILQGTGLAPQPEDRADLKVHLEDPLLTAAKSPNLLVTVPRRIILGLS